MSGNIFFDVKRLKYLGKNSIIGKTVRIRYPELVEIGDNCIIDDFTYISTSLKIGPMVHISANCSIIGGQNSSVCIEKFSTLAPGVVIAAGSDDYKSGLATPMVQSKFKGQAIRGDIVIGEHCIIGSGSVVLPNVLIGSYTAVGALSLVKSNLDSGFVYAGVPVRQISKRDVDAISELEELWSCNDEK